MHTRGGELAHQRHPLPIHQEMVRRWCLLTCFPRSVELGPVSSPPGRARRLMLSTLARPQSITSRSPTS